VHEVPCEPGTAAAPALALFTQNGFTTMNESNSEFRFLLTTANLVRNILG
jgi:hypothetical protein